MEHETAALRTQIDVLCVSTATEEEKVWPPLLNS
jgi:hypothetical protein